MASIDCYEDFACKTFQYRFLSCTGKGCATKTHFHVPADKFFLQMTSQVEDRCKWLLPTATTSRKLRQGCCLSREVADEIGEGKIMRSECKRLLTTSSAALARRLCIVGSGPAAFTAAIYAARAGLQPVLLEGKYSDFPPPGGQLTTTTDVENYPGFPEGIGGFELVNKFREQSVRFGTEVLEEGVQKVSFTESPFRVWGSGKTEIAAHAVIIATGASARRLHFPGSETFWNKGISACAVCDGAAPIFRDGRLAVIGGGDSAMEEALFLTRFAKKVYVIHRRDTLRASTIMQARAREHPKIEFVLSHVVEEALGNEGGLVSKIRLRSTAADGGMTELAVNGVFFAVGHEPSTQFLKDSGLQLEADGYVKTMPGRTDTNVPGIFACGDVTDRFYRQAVTAAGTGCMAALDAERYLSEQEAGACS